MTLRQVTVLNPIQTDETINQRYVKIRIHTTDFGSINTIVWEEHQPEMFEQILYAIDGLMWLDFPRIINLRIDGIVVTLDTPSYSPL